MYEYTLDAADRITYVSPDWLAFAADNEAQHLKEPDVLGSLIWDHVSDAECRQIYQALFAKVRESGKPLTVPFRCDSPTLKRFMQLTIAAVAAKALDLRGELIREEPRPYQALLDPTVGRSDKWITVCSWCKRIQDPSGAWCDVDDAVRELHLLELPKMPNITHGMCRECFDAVQREALDAKA